ASETGRRTERPRARSSIETTTISRFGSQGSMDRSTPAADVGRASLSTAQQLGPCPASSTRSVSTKVENAGAAAQSAPTIRTCEEPAAGPSAQAGDPEVARTKRSSTTAWGAVIEGQGPVS